MVEVEGAAGLLQRAIAEEGNAGAHGHGLRLIVRDIDDGGLETLVEFDQFGAELGAHFGVEVGEGFVEEEDTGLPDDGAPYGDALLLSAGEIPWHPSEEFFDAENGSSFVDAAGNVVRREMTYAKAESEVFGNAEVRVEGVILKDHSDISVAGREFADVGVPDEDASGGEALEAGDHA